MLQTVLDFTAHNPVLAVFLFVATEVFTVVLTSLLFELVNGFLRSRNIAKHGWPTPPLDADGDVVRPEREESELFRARHLLGKGGVPRSPDKPKDFNLRR